MHINFFPWRYILPYAVTDIAEYHIHVCHGTEVEVSIDLMHWRHRAAIFEVKRWRNNRNAHRLANEQPPFDLNAGAPYWNDVMCIRSIRAWIWWGKSTLKLDNSLIIFCKTQFSMHFWFYLLYLNKHNIINKKHQAYSLFTKTLSPIRLDDFAVMKMKWILNDWW